MDEEGCLKLIVVNCQVAITNPPKAVFGLYRLWLLEPNVDIDLDRMLKDFSRNCLSIPIFTESCEYLVSDGLLKPAKYELLKHG